MSFVRREKRALDLSNAPDHQPRKRQQVNNHPSEVNLSAHDKIRDETSKPVPTSRNTVGPEYYTVRWICALTTESIAAQTFLDEKYPDLPSHANDNNSYTLGRIWSHNIVNACLPCGNYIWY